MGGGVREYGDYTDVKWAPRVLRNHWPLTIDALANVTRWHVAAPLRALSTAK
jgi:hypothetical protein